MSNHCEMRYLSKDERRSVRHQRSWHIASYPRSGNHLVRAIIEAYTEQPTEGCLGAKRDIPIFQRPANRKRLIQIHSDHTIGYKAHTLEEIHERDRTIANGPMGVILITRDPVAAISSQATRILSDRRRYPWLTNRRKRIVIQEQVNLYLALVFRYASQRKEARIHLKFEDLVSKETVDRTVTEFLNKLEVCLQGPPLAEVVELAKESQNSLGDTARELKGEIEEEVRKRLSYAEVIQYIQE